METFTSFASVNSCSCFTPARITGPPLEAEPRGRATMQPVLTAIEYLLGEPLSTLQPREMAALLFHVLTKASAKFMPKQPFHWNQDVTPCEL